MEFSCVWIISNLRSVLFFAGTFISFYKRQKVSSILFLHITATCGFQVPRLYISGSEAKLKVELGFSTRLASIIIFLMLSGTFPDAMQCRLAKKGSKEKKIRKWAPCQISRAKNWSFWEKQMFGTANSSALSYSNSVRWSHPSLPVYAMLLSTATGF